MTLLVTPRAAEAAGPEVSRLSTSDPAFYTALGAATLPGIIAIARELAKSHAAQGERRAEVSDPSPPVCDAPL